MDNLYTPTKILSKDEFKKIANAFKKSWCKETATFGNVEKRWSAKNPPHGQCMVTACVVNDFFSGRLVYDRINHHYWNEFPDGTWQDFTREQFKYEVNFVVAKYKTKEDVLTDEYALRHNARRKYELLKQKFEQNYKG
jgi:hypothetical protein